MPAHKPLRNTRYGLPLRIACCLFSLLASGCFPVTRPVLKIALVAPFEGRYRDVGYEVTFAYRLAIREVNRAGGVGGYSIEMLSLDDSGDPDMAREQARKIIADPQVSHAFYERLRVPDKEWRLYEGLYHELFNETDRARVLTDLEGWLEKRL